MFSSNPSIRSIMISGIVYNAPKAIIKEQVVALFPDKMGAEKFDIHFKWYRGRVKKATTAEHRDALLLLAEWNEALTAAHQPKEQVA